MTMFNTLLLDQTAWDLVMDANGNIAMAAPPYAIAQDVATAVRTFVGDLYYAQDDGIPYFEKILGVSPPASLVLELINNMALSVSGVVTSQTTVTSFTERELTGYIEFTDESGQTTVVNF
jgi:hypothetical protein